MAVRVSNNNINLLTTPVEIAERRFWEELDEIQEQIAPPKKGQPQSSVGQWLKDRGVTQADTDILRR